MTDEIQKDELTVLKERADKMGVKYHPNISVEKLRERIAAELNDEPVVEEEAPVAAQKETEGQRRVRLKKEAAKQVRIRVACMNPNKKEWESEVFTVSNSVVGTFKKLVPFNNDEGWHVPFIIYQMLKDKKCQVFQTVTQNGVKVRKGKLINEYNIEVLPPLSKEELKDLAQRQAMSNSIDD